MKYFILLLVVISANVVDASAVDVNDKKWSIAIGPIFTNSMPGARGTKYNLTIAVRQDISEKVNRSIFYDGNFNSASQGSTGITSLGLAYQFLTLDRGAKSSPFFHVSLAYGGGNRYIDYAPILGGGVGFEFFRNQKYSLEIIYRKIYLITRATTQVGGTPNVDQLKIGINF